MNCLVLTLFEVLDAYVFSDIPVDSHIYYGFPMWPFDLCNFTFIYLFIHLFVILVIATHPIDVNPCLSVSSLGVYQNIAKFIFGCTLLILL